MSPWCPYMKSCALFIMHTTKSVNIQLSQFVMEISLTAASEAYEYTPSYYADNVHSKLRWVINS